ncbi:carbohydrate kinase family protein [Streptacidiphilus monticola]|uniref:Carbohydrate kinase family protein n=1 Tax=Streptacidiphilus monticola TaxID=2161674 RepID=A0ABW1G5B5_9ACTN
MSGAGLLVVGDVVTDVLACHAEPLAPATDTAARISIRPGGSAANTAAWAARSGADVRLLARVGADSAEWHRAALAGVRAQLRVDQEHPTAVVICLVDAEGERTMVTERGAGALLGPEDWDDALLAGVDRIHLSGYLLFSAPGRELARLLLARGLPVSVDPASTGFLAELGPDVFLDLVAGADLLLPNAAEARLLARAGDAPAEDAARLLSRRGPTVVVKLGADGAVVASGGELLARVPAAPVPRVTDTTGAGDAFAGGYLAGLLHGAPPAAACASGCAQAAEAVHVLGGRPPTP